MNRVLRLLFVAGFLVNVVYGATPPKSTSPALPDASIMVQANHEGRTVTRKFVLRKSQ